MRTQISGTQHLRIMQHENRPKAAYPQKDASHRQPPAEFPAGVGAWPKDGFQPVFQWRAGLCHGYDP